MAKHDPRKFVTIPAFSLDRRGLLVVLSDEDPGLAAGRVSRECGEKLA
jgi:hypothetical protein